MITTIPTSTHTADFINYYQALGLQPNWDTEKIRVTLRDRFAATKAHLHAATGEKLDSLTLQVRWILEANQILLDPDARAQYDRELAAWKGAHPSELGDSMPEVPTLENLWQLIILRHYSEAIQVGKQLIEQFPESDRAWEAYAYVNYLCDNFQAAVHAAQRAIRCNPEKAEYYADYSQYLAASEQWDEAIDQLNQAIRLDPHNTGYKLALGHIYIQHSHWGDAEAVLQGVLSQEPTNQTARFLMAIVIGAKAEARFPEVDELIKADKKREARKLLKEIQQQFEAAQKLAGDDPELKDLLNSESILVRRVLGVNFYRRILGLGIDALLISPAILLMVIGGEQNSMATIAGIVLLISILGYSWVWLGFKNQGQDLTKRLLGLQVVSDRDALPTSGQLIGRAIVKPIAIGLGGLFPFLVFMLSTFTSMGQANDAASGIAVVIGLIIGFIVLFFKLSFDLFFVTSKELLPNFFGFILFLHEHLTKTTVINSTKDDFMNFSEYHWY